MVRECYINNSCNIFNSRRMSVLEFEINEGDKMSTGNKERDVIIYCLE